VDLPHSMQNLPPPRSLPQPTLRKPVNDLKKKEEKEKKKKKKEEEKGMKKHQGPGPGGFACSILMCFADIYD